MAGQQGVARLCTAGGQGWCSRGPVGGWGGSGGCVRPRGGRYSSLHPGGTLCADFPATLGWMASCAGMGKVAEGWWLLSIVIFGMVYGAVRRPVRPGWGSRCFRCKLCGYAGAYGNGAPCASARAGAWGSWGACGGSWVGSGWGRRRRRQRVEEGRDVSGKSWVVGKVVC